MNIWFALLMPERFSNPETSVMDWNELNRWLAFVMPTRVHKG